MALALGTQSPLGLSGNIWVTWEGAPSGWEHWSLPDTFMPSAPTVILPGGEGMDTHLWERKPQNTDPAMRPAM